MPTSDKLHVDSLLSNVSVKYRNAEYVADRIFPAINVKKQSDVYRTFARNFRVEETVRANRGIARELDFDITTSSYKLKRHSLRNLVSDTDVQNFDAGDLRVEHTEDLTDAILRRREYEVAYMLTHTNWSLYVSLTSGLAWNDNSVTGNPIAAVETGCATVIGNSGMKPNYMHMRHDVYLAAKNHTSILDRIKYTSAEIDVNVLARLFGISEIHVSVAQKDTSAEGVTASLGYFFEEHAFLGYKPSAAGPSRMSSGYIFENASVPRVKRYRDEEREGEWIEVNQEYDIRAVATLSAYLIKDCV